MRRSWKRPGSGDDFEAGLRRARPEPHDEFLNALQARVDEAQRQARGRRALLGFAGAVTAAMLTALASVGGFSYAATATNRAVTAMTRVVAPARTQAASPPAPAPRPTAGSDQYRPGFGWGDKNHVHTGPPGLAAATFDTGVNGTFTPPPSSTPLQAALTGDKTGFFVKTALKLDEQADLKITVVDENGQSLVLMQRRPNGKPGSFVGGPLTGANRVKSLGFRVLVPRTIPIVLGLPAKSAKPGTYTITIVATDPNGATSTMKIPFTVA